MGIQGRALFRGTFYKKDGELSVSVFQICAELWVLIEETCGNMGTLSKIVSTVAKKNKGYAKIF